MTTTEAQRGLNNFPRSHSRPNNKRLNMKSIECWKIRDIFTGKYLIGSL